MILTLLAVIAVDPSVVEAMRVAFPDRPVEIEIVTAGGAGLTQPGELHFPLSGLSRPAIGQPDAAVTWRGSRRLQRNTTLPIWATVRIRESATWVEAVAPLPLNQAIAEGQVVRRTGYRFPLAVEPITALDEVVGQRARRTIRTGEILTRAMIRPAGTVARGETVTVEVVSGAVVLRFEARAENDAAAGDIVLVSTPQQRRFKTHVKEPGKVTIDAKSSSYTFARSAGASSGAKQVGY